MKQANQSLSQINQGPNLDYQSKNLDYIRNHSTIQKSNDKFAPITQTDLKDILKKQDDPYEGLGPADRIKFSKVKENLAKKNYTRMKLDPAKPLEASQTRTKPGTQN